MEEQDIKEYFDRMAPNRDKWKKKSRYYYSHLENFISFVVPENKRVVEIGCGTGDLLFKLKPSYGLGIDISEKMIELARQKNTNSNQKIEFKAGAIDNIDGLFDYIILSDLIGYLPDIEEFFRKLSRITHPQSKLIITQYNQLWEPVLNFASKIGLRMPVSFTQNWINLEDINNFLRLTGFETVKSGKKILFPKNIPFVSKIINNYLINLWPLNKLALVNYVVARPIVVDDKKIKPSFSVIVPARNEAGTIEKIVQQIPEVGLFTEIIFVEGHSQDSTLEEIKMVEEKYRGKKRIKYAIQEGKGKGDAVRLGFEIAEGDILAIYDADMTVPAKDLEKFYIAITDRKGEFINGSRLVYPLERESMRSINYLGNKFFSYMFSWILGQPTKDTLCGTKVLWKKDYQDIKVNRKYFGDFDPFGDFDLLFGAAKLNLKIVEVPIRYKAREYGKTNISRFKHGWLLLKMVFFAMRKIKFK